MSENLFIAFEGLDGSGKSTQARLLADRLAATGARVYKTSEPTDGHIGRMIRDIFQHKIEADHRTIAALFVADRLDHILSRDHGILAKWKNGYTVITDRYYFSSYAYHGSHMDMDWVIEANSLSADLMRPDLNVYIDLPPEISMQRLGKRKSSTELYETVENLRVVREKYFEAFDKLKTTEKIFITDGNRSTDEIAKNIWQKISEIIQEKKMFDGKSLNPTHQG